MEITGTITILELVWTFISLLGVIFHGRLNLEVLSEIVAIRYDKSLNGIRQYGASITMVAYGTFLAMSSVFLLLGLISMTVPTTKGGVSVGTWIISFLLIAANLGMAVTGFKVEKMRSELIRRIRDSQKIGV